MRDDATPPNRWYPGIAYSLYCCYSSELPLDVWGRDCNNLRTRLAATQAEAATLPCLNDILHVRWNGKISQDELLSKQHFRDL